MSTTSKSKRQSPRSDKELLVETMIEAADDALFLQRGAADETTIEFGHSDHDEDDLLSFDHNNPMFHLKRNLDQDFCDSSTDSYWEDEKKSAGPKWDVTLANSVEVLKSHLRESSESRWTGKTVPESPKFHEIKPRPLPKSTQEQEEEEMKQIKPFQARNAPRFEKPNMETKPSPATTPQPFHFHSTTRKRPISVPPSKEDVDLQECQQFRFKARPIPKSVLLTSTKSPEVSRIPRLSLPSASQKSASRIPRSSHSLQLAPKITSKPSRIPRSTPSSKVEKICVEMEIKTMRVEFHMTSNEHAERQPTARNVALPLQLNCLERHEAFKQKQAEKLREEEKKNRQMACFKARPLPASMQKRRVVSQSPKIIGNAPKVIARIPKSSPRYSIKSPSKPVEETKAAEEEDFRAVVVRLIQITSTVVILHLIVWYGTSPEYLWQIHRQFRDETVNSASFDGWPQVTYETENVPQYLAKATEILHPFASPINEAPRSEDVSLTANSDVALKYVLNVAENDVAFNQSIDTAENTGLVKEAQRGIPAQDDSVERLKLSHNDVSPEKTKAKAARAKVQHYFEGLTLADPESIHRAALQRVTSQNTKAHIVGPKTRLEDEDHAHDVTLDHPESSAKLPDEAEPVRRRAGIYFDFLQGFITPDVPQSKERRIRPQKSAGSDYHVQRWLDLSIDELMVLNGMFGVRLDSSFQKDVYRLE